MKRGIKFYINWFLFQIYSKTVFKAERFLYKKFFRKNIKHRIFLSSGNISLINALTIIKQFPEENCEDILVIDTLSGKKEFFDVNLKAASIHNFKKIVISDYAKDDRAHHLIMKYNLFNIDEIYAHTKFDYTRYIFPMFKDCKIHIFDEGFGSLIEQYHPGNEYVTDLMTVKYCDKFDRLGWDNKPIIHTDAAIFREIASGITKEHPFDIEISPDSKTVIFCGSYWQAYEMGKEPYYEYQNNIMQKLIDNGFTVIYKAHPRDTADIKLPEKIIKTNCFLPLELYKLDILGVVSVASFISLQEYHYWNIPGFSDINETTFKNSSCGDIEIIRTILKEYTPNVNELFKINANDYSKEELKTMLLNIFKSKFDNQPVLSENKTTRERYDEYINELKSRQKG